MFYRIFLCVIISETIRAASSESNYDNGLLNTITLENNNTPTKHPTNANVVRKWLERKNFVGDSSTPTNFHYVSQNKDEEDDLTTNLSFRRVGNDQQTILKKILGRWVSLMKNKLKRQIPALNANEQYSLSANVLTRLDTPKILREEGFFDKPSLTNQKQLSIKGDNDILTPQHFVPRPLWMQNQIEFSSAAIKNDGSEERKQPKLIHLIPEPWLKQYVIDDRNIPNSERNNQQLFNTTENELLRETDFIHSLAQRTIITHKAKKVTSKPTTANPSTTQRTHALEAEQVNTQENDFQNWGLQLFDSKTNKLFEEEHDYLENVLQKNKKQQEATSQTLLESAEVDDDRNKALRQKVETWYSNLQSRRELANLGVSPEMRNIVRFRRNLQSALVALFQRRQLSEWQRSHAADYRKLSRYQAGRRQLLSQYSMPQAVDYRRLLSSWRKELRRQLQIKWNRRPLVEISPGAFKSDIYVNPPDDLAKHMQKLLALKKRQEERHRDLNENAE